MVGDGPGYRCSVCKEDGELFCDFKFSGLDQNAYYLCKCKKCHTVFTGPTPTAETLQRAYDKCYWNTTDLKEAKQGINRWVANFNAWRLKQVIRPLLNILPPDATVLEVGCGAGQLSQILLHHGIRVEVTEYSPEMLDLVTTRLTIKGYLGDLTEIEFNRRYDAVIFNNVLEHVSSPLENLQRAASLLNPGGFVFIEVPNINSLQFAFFKHRWFPLEIPFHLTHFEPATLDNLARQTGLTLRMRSFFSMRVSMAGIVVSLFPMFDPRNLRKRGSSRMLLAYLVMQAVFLPLALVEGVLGRGGIMRSLYSK